MNGLTAYCHRKACPYDLVGLRELAFAAEIEWLADFPHVIVRDEPTVHESNVEGMVGLTLTFVTTDIVAAMFKLRFSDVLEAA